MKPTSRERRLSRARWGEVAVGVLAVIGLPPVFLWPALLPGYLGFLTLSTLAGMYWQYRLMDEFRRVRYLRAWATAGAVGFTGVTALSVWAIVPLAPRGGPGLSVAISVPIWGLYLPWAAMLLAFFGVTAYLYQRDTRG